MDLALLSTCDWLNSISGMELIAFITSFLLDSSVTQCSISLRIQSSMMIVCIVMLLGRCKERHVSIQGVILTSRVRLFLNMEGSNVPHRFFLNMEGG